MKKEQRSPRQWTQDDKYEALLESARLTGEELGKWLRENGLRSEHIEIWRQIILTWETATKVDTAGFNIYRAKSEKGEYTKITSLPILANGSPTQGATYEFEDSDVQNRKTYYYKLEDIDLNGNSTMHGPESATPRLIYGIKNLMANWMKNWKNK